MIKHVSLAHGWYYFFRLHTERLGSLPNSLSNLNSYLLDMLENCPDEKFQSGPRSSKLRVDLGIEPKEVPMHPVMTFAEQGLDWGKYKTAHSNVQVFMLENDPQTLAVEAPIWLENDEMNKYENFFEEKNPLSGHIDLLRVEDGNVWIWDYKPKAHKEKYATTQTFFYSLMLSKRTGIPLKKMRCGYFDDESCFVFKPEEKFLKNINL